MSRNAIFPLPKESDTTSEKVKQKVGIWMIPNRHWSLLLKRLSKKGVLSWLIKKIRQNKMLWRNPSLLLFQNKIKFTQSTKEINHKHLIKQ